ncbi:hypothetical protein EVA_04677 [gut metagenome]|uniref:Uncharacterized protein n=1 Tax=gut metagenome TaxID=749906 RepID=J9D3I2_9ZZZZ
MLVIYIPPLEEPVSRVYYAREKIFRPSGTSGKQKKNSGGKQKGFPSGKPKKEAAASKGWTLTTLSNRAQKHAARIWLFPGNRLHLRATFHLPRQDQPSS